MGAIHIIAGDMVQVTTGEDRGTKAKVLRVDRKRRKVVVEGVNRVLKHIKRSQQNPQGGRLSKEMPVDIANVMLISPATGQPTRTGVRVTKEGVRELFCKKSGTTIRRLTAQTAGDKK